MTEKTVDVAELVKQHQELGDQIVKLGGKIASTESDAGTPTKKSVERVKIEKAKKAKDEEEADDMLDADDGDDAPTPTKKTKKAAPAADDIEKGADESIEYQGQTIRKSVIGEAQFAIIKSLTADVTKAAADIAKAQDDALTARLEKRAADQYANVPGTIQDRASMLKAMEKMEEPVRKAFEAVFTQSEKLAKAAFDTLGTSNGGDTADMKKARQDFDAKVTEIAKRDNVGRAAAMAKARTEHPDLFKAYNSETN